MIPEFDLLTYQKILSRAGRIKRNLSSKQLGSNAYIRLSDSLKRTNSLKSKLVNTYINELAIYIVIHDIEVSMFALKQQGIITHDRVASILLHEWKTLLSKINTARKARRGE